MMLNGIPVYISPLLTERVLDARSPARARRRAKRGFAQHYITRPMNRIFKVGSAFHMHPETAAKLRRVTEGL